MNWQQQTDKPLFPDLLWSRPETKTGAGKLLIIGGQAQEFVNVARAYTQAENAGAGTVRVFLPDSTRKLTKMLPHIEHAAANTSGSFSRSALAALLEAAGWSDGVLLPGDLGKNSETSLIVEDFICKYTGLLTIADDAIQSIPNPSQLFKRENTVLVLSFSTFQKLAIQLQRQTAITSGIGDPALADYLHQLTTDLPISIVIQHKNNTWVATKGNVSQTIGKAQNAAHFAVWAIQNPTKHFQAFSTAAYC